MKRVLAIGLDAADEVDLERRLAAGSMPNLAALRERGTWCSLAVDTLCRSEHPWTAFVTGLEPEHSGRWTPIGFDPATYHYASADALDREPFWALGDRAKVVALDIPAATLARDLQGVHVVDWLTHDPMYPRCSSPAPLMATLDDLVGENPAAALEYAGAWHEAEYLRAYGAALVTSVEQRTEVIQYLLATTAGWNLGVVVFAELHQLSHDAWHGMAPGSVFRDAPSAAVGREALDAVYRATDVAIGRIVEGLEPEDVVVVFSPKGHEPLCDLLSNTLAPELLHRLAFGAPLLHQPSVRRWQRRGQPPVVLPTGMSHVAHMRGAFGDRRWRRARAAIRRTAFAAATAVAPGPMGRLTMRVRAARNVRPPGGVPDPTTLAPLDGDLRYDRWFVATWYRPWWPEMRAFVVPSFADLHLRVNLAGREAEGIVALDDYQQACAEVAATFQACRNPRTGHPLVAEVLFPRAGDPFAEIGVPADVVIRWAEDADTLEHPDIGVVGPYPAWRAGGHAARGFALVAGGDVAPGRVDGNRIVDLTATILDLAGVEPREPIDGRPIGVSRRSTARA